MRLFTALLLALGMAAAGYEATVADPPASLNQPTADTLATLDRTPCFGMCPSYRIVIYRDGRLAYEGRRFVDVEGPAEDMLDASTLARLRAAFEEAAYFNFRDRYTSGSVCESVVTDLPTVTTSFHTEEASKKVVHNHGCRGFDGKERLQALEDSIDTIAGTERWVGSH